MNGSATQVSERYLRCRRLLFREGRTEDGEPASVCADFCRTPIGMVSILDCPVWLGKSCRYFEEREGEPEPTLEAELEEMSDLLRTDYLRWRYWRRIHELRAAVVAGTAGVLAGPEDPLPVSAHEIPARPEAVRAPRRKPRFPGDAPSGPPPRPVEEVDLDHLPELVPGTVEETLEEPDGEPGS
jgi:hypothetical protein